MSLLFTTHLIFIFLIKKTTCHLNHHDPHNPTLYHQLSAFLPRFLHTTHLARSPTQLCLPESYLLPTFFFFKNSLIFILFEREVGRDLLSTRSLPKYLHQLVSFLKAHNSWGWGWPKPGAGSAVRVFHVHGRASSHHLLPPKACICRTLNLKVTSELKLYHLGGLSWWAKCLSLNASANSSLDFEFLTYLPMTLWK